MKTLSIRDAKNRLTELARKVEEGETIVVTRNGRPVFDLVPRQKRGGLQLAAGKAFLLAKGITRPVPFIADDFDVPLPEDFGKCRHSMGGGDQEPAGQTRHGNAA